MGDLFCEALEPLLCPFLLLFSHSVALLELMLQLLLVLTLSFWLPHPLLKNKHLLKYCFIEDSWLRSGPDIINVQITKESNIMCVKPASPNSCTREGTIIAQTSLRQFFSALFMPLPHYCASVGRFNPVLRWFYQTSMSCGLRLSCWLRKWCKMSSSDSQVRTASGPCMGYYFGSTGTGGNRDAIDPHPFFPTIIQEKKKKTTSKIHLSLSLPSLSYRLP